MFELPTQGLPLVCSSLPRHKPGGKPHQKLLYGKTRGDVSEALSKQCRKF